jgi:type I restriction enzyme, S subunit
MADPATIMRGKLGDFFAVSKEKGVDDLPMLSVTMRNGLVRRDSLDRKMDSELEDGDHLRVRPGDIAYNMMRMWQGASGLATDDGIVSPAYVVVRPKKSVDPLFASYWFKSERMIYLFWAYSYGLTSDRLRLYGKDFTQIPVDLPPLSEQRRIAEILSDFDHAIEATDALVETKQRRLNRLRRSIFQAATSEVFLSDYAVVTTGSPAPQDKDVFSRDGHPFVRVSDLESLIAGIDDCERISEGTARRLRLKLFPEGTILFAKSGMSAALTRVVRLPRPSYIVSHLAAVVPSSIGSLLYHWLHYDHPSRLLQGDGFPSLRTSDLKEFPVRLPPEDERELAAELLDTAEIDVKRTEEISLALRKQRRGLMQRLLSPAQNERAPGKPKALTPTGKSPIHNKALVASSGAVEG